MELDTTAAQLVQKGRGIFEARAQSQHVDIDDEYARRNQAAPFNVLHPVSDWVAKSDLYGDKELVNIDQKVEQEFVYFAATRDLEFGSARTDFLEAVTKRMIEGTEIPKVRVVIMNKGIGYEAFVTPDGTILISQSILNLADSIDQIGGVLAHEVNHLVNSTFEKVSATSGRVTPLTVGFVHEAASDIFVSQLLEKAGLNSIAGSTFIKDISGDKRGVTHQSGLARASQSVALHMVVDYGTSAKDPQSAQMLHKETVKKTNLELLREALQNGRQTHIRQILRSLHPRDLATAFEVINSVASEKYRPQGKKQPFESIYTAALDAYFGILDERLAETGASKEERKLFIYSYFSSRQMNSMGYVPLLFRDQSQSDVYRMATQLAEFYNHQKQTYFSTLLFDGKTRDFRSQNLIWDDLQKLTESPIGLQISGGMPLSEDVIFAFVQSQLDFEDPIFDFDKYRERSITDLLLGYVDVVYLAQAGAEGVDETKIRNFLNKARAMNISIDPIMIGSYVNPYKIAKQPDGTSINIPEHHQQIVAKIFRDVFKRDTERQFDQNMTQSVGKWKSQREAFGNNSSEKGFCQYLNDMQGFFRRNEISTDERRLDYIDQLRQAIADTEFSAKFDIFRYLDTPHFETIRRETLSTEAKIRNNQLIRFNLQLIAGLALFTADGPEFYHYMERIMRDSNIDVANYSKTQLFRLCTPLFTSQTELGKVNIRGSMDIYDADDFSSRFIDGLDTFAHTEAFENLPFIKALIVKSDVPQPGDLHSLVEYAKKYMSKTNLREGGKEGSNLYSDRMDLVIMGADIRQEFGRLLSEGISDGEMDGLFDFVRLFFPEGVPRSSLMRDIAIKILDLPTSLDKKINFLARNFDDIGIEGAIQVAEQIDTLEDFRHFKTRLGSRLTEYLDGSGKAKIVAGADIASSFVAGDFEKVLASCQDSPDAQTKASTEFASGWFDAMMEYGLTIGEGFYSIQYDASDGKFELKDGNRDVFKTIGDIFRQMHDLSPSTRAAMVHKLLTEKEGGLATEKNRRKLADGLLRAVGVPSGFISNILREVIQYGDPVWLNFPAGRMLAPLLFRVYDTNRIDPKSLGKKLLSTSKIRNHPNSSESIRLKELFSPADLQKVIDSPTRDVVKFGQFYTGYPDSMLYQLAHTSDSSYRDALQILESVGRREPEAVANGTGNLLPQNQEAVVQGMEALGAMGVRNLQLTRQLYPFSPEVRARLSRSFDANPGLNKLLFWVNLDKLAANGDPAISHFVGRRLVSVGKKLGAGSLFTTYAAVVAGDQRKKQEVVLKMLNPNAVAIVTQTAKMGMDALTTVRDRSRGRDRKHAEIGMSLIGLTQKWCLNDINDPHFVEDDEWFRRTISLFNTQQKQYVIYAPERVLDTVKLKSETEAPGVTLNALLEDPKVDRETKRKVIDALWQFFRFQLAHKIPNDEGVEEYVCHADPHVGNFMIDSTGKHMRIGVIDRNMYLRLEDRDVEVIHTLLQGKHREFLDKLVDRSLETNRILNRVEQKKIKRNIGIALIKEKTRQKLTGKSDDLAYLQIVLSQLALHDAEASLELQLMIRNVAAFEELRAEYQVT